MALELTPGRPLSAVLSIRGALARLSMRRRRFGHSGPPWMPGSPRIMGNRPITTAHLAAFCRCLGPFGHLKSKQKLTSSAPAQALLQLYLVQRRSTPDARVVIGRSPAQEFYRPAFRAPRVPFSTPSFAQPFSPDSPCNLWWIECRTWRSAP